MTSEFRGKTRASIWEVSISNPQTRGQKSGGGRLPHGFENAASISSKIQKQRRFGERATTETSFSGAFCRL